MPRPRRATGQAPRRFDTLLKRLVESSPAAWLQALGFGQPTAVTSLNPTASAVVLAADAVLRIDEPSPWLVHLEFQSRRDRTLPRRVLGYNVWLNARHNLPVASVAVPLWPRVDGPELTGLFRLDGLDGTAYLSFGYQVFRPWQQPIEPLLAGDPLTLPLVALAGLSIDDLPSAIGRMRERLAGEPQEVAGLIWTATNWLLGARLRPEVVARLLSGVEEVMRESSTYQQVLAEGRVEGRVEGARAVLLQLGARQFGPPDARVRAALDAIGDPEQIAQLSNRLLEVGSWDELLATP